MIYGLLTPPVLLSEGHDLSAFDCGEPLLDDWLTRRALSNQRSGASRSYVVCVGNRVVAYYCLATGAVSHDDVSAALRRNMPDPIPVVILGRLAVDRQHQGRRLGRALLKDALQRSLQVAETVGVTAVLVHAISDRARDYYRERGFLESPGNPMTLCLPMATVRNTGQSAIHH